MSTAEYRGATTEYRGIVVGDERVMLGPGLSGVVHRPCSKSPASVLVIFLHGLGDHAHYQDDVVRACLAQQGTAALAVDFPGHGESTGQRGHVDEWTTYHRAVERCVEYGRKEFPTAEIILFGNSMGGLIAIEMAYSPTVGPQLAAVLASAPMVTLPVNAVVKEALKGIGWLAPTKTIDLDVKAKAPRHGQCTLGWLRHAASACDHLKTRQPDTSTAPITLFIGDKDPIVTLAAVRELGDRLACDTLLLYADSGHEPFANDRFGRPDPNKSRYLGDVAMIVNEVVTLRSKLLDKDPHHPPLGPKLLPRW